MPIMIINYGFFTIAIINTAIIIKYHMKIDMIYKNINAIDLIGHFDIFSFFLMSVSISFKIN